MRSATSSLSENSSNRKRSFNVIDFASDVPKLKSFQNFNLYFGFLEIVDTSKSLLAVLMRSVIINSICSSYKI